MPRGCTICQHPQRLVIETKRRVGASLRGLAAHWRLHKDALARHFRHCTRVEVPELRRATCGHCHTSIHMPETCRWCHALLCGRCFEANEEIVPGPCGPWYDMMAAAAGVSVEEYVLSLGVGHPRMIPASQPRLSRYCRETSFPRLGAV